MVENKLIHVIVFSSLHKTCNLIWKYLEINENK